jgi:hypothetical protein
MERRSEADYPGAMSETNQGWAWKDTFGATITVLAAVGVAIWFFLCK